MIGYNILLIAVWTVVVACLIYAFECTLVDSWHKAVAVFVVAAVFVCFGYVLWTGHDEAVAKAADRFFMTRDRAYSCDLPDGYACNVRLKKWREDSVYWYGKVQDILDDED